MHKPFVWKALGSIALAGASFAIEGEARACGGCFHQQTESTVVNDHRMAFAISQAHTILWDQIEYSGDPKEFAWVLPVSRGTVVQLSRDEWMAALDSTTRPIILSPPPPAADDGCDGIGCSTSTSDMALSPSSGGQPAVDVVAQSVVGPYETVTLRSEDPQALQTWLRDHGYAIQPTIEPVIAAYASLKLDFLALRLRPGQGVKAMKPVRVVTPGADPTLPLRMVAAGVGANVGLTLFVIAEGRYRPQNFPEVAIDPSKLVWKTSEGRSNYQELSLAQMAGAPGGRGWLVEWANPAFLASYPGRGVGNLSNAYKSQCSRSFLPPSSPTSPSGDDPRDPSLDPPVDAAVDASDDAASDASTDAGRLVDAGIPSADAGDADAGSPSSSTCTSESDCCAFDDLDLAIKGMSENDVWVTRLRANLPLAALNMDLKLEAAPKQEAVSGFYTARPEPSSTASVAPLRRGRIAGSATLLLGVAFLVSRILRRRPR